MPLERSWGNEINRAIAIATVKDEILSQGDPGHKTFSIGLALFEDLQLPVELEFLKDSRGKKS